jgi:hypothetical protein
MTLRRLSRPLAIGLATLALLAGSIWCSASKLDRGAACSVASLHALLASPASALRRVDIAGANLLCGQGLPGTVPVNLRASLAQLEEMAARVRSETQRHLYRFQSNPVEFENSEGFFRMVMLAGVLAEDFGVRYAPGKIGKAAEARPDDGFFADARYVFLQGLLTARGSPPSLNLQPSTLNLPGGTCSSLPVLQVAVGRRLGYPPKLVTTKGHLFVRWEDAHQRFNIEAAGQGVNRSTDEYYRHWPLEVSAAEETAEGYLKSLTPAEELAVFLSIRGMCLREAGRLPEAAEAFAAAACLAPACRGYQVVLASLRAAGGASFSVKPRTPKTSANDRNLNL